MPLHLKNLSLSQLVTNVIAGSLSGIIMIISATAVGALIFKGPLSLYFSEGIACALLSSVILNSITAGFSAFKFGIARTDPTIAVIIGLMFTHIASYNLTPTVLFPTLIMTLCITTFIIGIAMLLLGWFEAGQVVRFLPYPVLGGIIASTAWIMSKESMKLMLNNNLTLANFLQGPTPYVFATGIGFAILLVVAGKKIARPWVLPAAILLGTCAVNFILHLNHINHAQASALGWLYPAKDPTFALHEIDFYAVQKINWSIILDQFNYIATLTILSVIIILLNVSTLEVLTKTRANLERELKIAGVGNILSGFGAATPGNIVVTGTLLNKSAGATNRIAGLMGSVICLLVLIVHPHLIAFLPKPLIAGLLLSISVNLLIEWLYYGWYKLPHVDYLILLLILATVVIWGFLPGIAMGIFITCMVFIIRYARSDTIKYIATGNDYHSNVIRSLHQEEWLAKHGDSIIIFKLQGYLFFGSAKLLFDKVEQLLADGHIKFLIFDFSAVNDVDSSAGFSYLRLQQLIDSCQVKAIFTNCRQRVLLQLQRFGIVNPESTILVLDNLDQAMEWCETTLLTQLPHIEPINSLGYTSLSELVPDLKQRETFMRYLEKIQAPANYTLVKQGELVDCLYFIESGEVSVYLENGDGDLRLIKSGAGTIIGEIGFYLHTLRTATVRTETDCIIYKISQNALDKLEKDHPDIAMVFHKSVIYVLAMRVIHTNNELKFISK